MMMCDEAQVAYWLAIGFFCGLIPACLLWAATAWDFKQYRKRWGSLDW